MTIPKSQKLNHILNPLHYHGICMSVKERTIIRNLIEEKCERAKKLPPHKKLMFLMYYDHGHSMKEIGKLCGLSEGQVSRRLLKIAEEISDIENSEKGELDV